jgi:uncharacterized protein involved in exopolysaccharide biosynthesis
MRDRKGAESLSLITAAPVASWEQMPKEPHLLDYLIILKKHQWLVLSFLLTVLTVVTIATFKIKPVYVAAARVEVDREAQSIQPFPESNSYDDYVDTENYIETQTKILQSETLALQTIKSMDLGRYPEFGGKTNTFTIPHAGFTSQRHPLLGSFLGALSIQRVKDSRLIEVRFEAQDPQLAAQIVNGHLQNYIEANFRSKYDATTQASIWLSSELEDLRMKVERSEAAKIAYKSGPLTRNKISRLRNSRTSIRHSRKRKLIWYRNKRFIKLQSRAILTNSPTYVTTRTRPTCSSANPN